LSFLVASAYRTYDCSLEHCVVHSIRVIKPAGTTTSCWFESLEQPRQSSCF